MNSRNAVKEGIVEEKVEVQVEEHGASPVPHPNQEEIRRRAFEIHIERGGIHGCDLNDWMQAEKELMEKLHG
jgi:Protein of unknown function (DUF2934)